VEEYVETVSVPQVPPHYDNDHHLMMHINNTPHSHHPNNDPHHNFKEDEFEDINDRMDL
jgi:hypothetical protein